MKKITPHPKSRSLAFQQRARKRAAPQAPEAPNGHSPRPASQQTPRDQTPRAILAEVKERARRMPRSAVPAVAGAFPDLEPHVDLEAGLRDEAADVLTSRELPPSDDALAAAEAEIRRRVHVKRCPRCRQSVALAHRKRFDRIVGVALPVHRWACASCGWTGLRMDRHEKKRLRRRITVIVIVILAFFVGLALMWFLDYLKYSRPSADELPPAVSSP